jgi:nicotinate-nucleotide adenylyltransferase
VIGLVKSALNSTVNHNALRKIGLFGGTFDPPHWGHIRLAEHFCKLFTLDELIWIPSGNPWQKSSDITSAENRVLLSNAAVETLRDSLKKMNLPCQVTLNRIEVDRPGPSLTIDTVKELRNSLNPNASFIFLMGADSFMSLPTWHDWRDLLSHIHIAVANRPNYSIEREIQSKPMLQSFYQSHKTTISGDLEIHSYGMIYLDNELSVDLASNQIRQQLSDNNDASLQNALPPLIYELIKKLKLYQPHL